MDNFRKMINLAFGNKTTLVTDFCSNFNRLAATIFQILKISMFNCYYLQTKTK